MNPALYAALGAFVSVVGLALAFVKHITDAAFKQGRNDSRLEALEKSSNENDGCAVQLAALNATLQALQASMEDMRHNIKNLWQALQERQSGSRRNASGNG